MKLYSTPEVAAAVGISRVTLQRWIEQGRIQPPPKIKGNLRLWTEKDIGRLGKLVPRLRYKSGNGRKKKQAK